MQCRLLEGTAAAVSRPSECGRARPGEARWQQAGTLHANPRPGRGLRTPRLDPGHAPVYESPMNEQLLDRYIDVLLDACLNFQKGQNLQIQGEPIHWPVYNRVAEAAYRRGARYVEVQAPHPGLLKARVDHSETEYLDYLPGYLVNRVHELTGEAWPRLAFVGSEDPDFFSTVNAQRNAQVQKATRIVHKPLMQACSANKIPWVVAALPTPGWAARVLGCEPSGQAMEDLWDIMIPILRLDQPDPIAAWKANTKALERRSAALNGHGFDSIHFEGPGTDLTLGLITGGQWAGGGGKLPDGRHFIANIPTEENFTAPHWRRTNGRVRVTRPVEVLNKSVEGAWFVFKDGRVVEFGADKGREQIEQYFSPRRAGPVSGRAGAGGQLLACLPVGQDLPYDPVR
jgi:aminopeptidase